ncbi:lactate utilization protein [Clostridium sp. D2Q-11]|uniref:Lactate utilization protein n=1 Tax=Anaeromonas frigoriresistens TaxID=2683708 RepID=A0A942UVR8_9FIRM|nr:lactate utilization protein [Anaeromonas frigoriresistens]MBS4540149.1 lactate utilization protein [Anaeromonas frigoriresistens]
MDRLINRTIESLQKNGFIVDYFEDINGAKKHILEKIDQKVDVGIGGSMTIFESGLHTDLMDRGNGISWHWLEKPEDKYMALERASRTPIYMSSANAITQDGKIINIDGVGNRVASTFYGHDTVYIIAGVNKIVENIEDGIKRIKTDACPKNAERLGLNTPCRHTGKCHDCKSDDRMCNVTVIIESKPAKTDINIILVNESLGY